MICPVCKRDLAPTLSICLTCGAMVNDTVREELQSKISKTPETARGTSGGLTASPGVATPPPRIEAPKMQAPNQTATPAKPLGTRFETADLREPKKTSPTLVEFQTKKATVPEWRLQLQNSVRQKTGANRRADETGATDTPRESKPQSTRGANALKVEFVEEENQEPQARHQNPRVANALQRIEESRRAFSNHPVPEQSLKIGRAQPQQPATRNFPFNVVAKSNETAAKSPGSRATVNPSPKPILVSPFKIGKKGFDTNKLPSLETQSPTHSRSFITADGHPTPRNAPTNASIEENELIEVETDVDEIEDLASLPMRFNAGLFDMIIGFFASLILLSPFIISGGAWLSISGLLAITAAVAIVTFLYLTISIAFFGRTFGMRLFSLELVDVEENAYPTMHQAAVNSAVFLLSIMFAGVGFIPMFFNEERRAAHDILSGTILLREF